jgi:hypothetical protein
MLEYTLDGAEIASRRIPVDWDYVQQKVEHFLRLEQASPNSFDKVCDWISVSIITSL